MSFSPTTRAAPDKRPPPGRAALHGILLTLSAGLVYARSLDVPLMYDDIQTLPLARSVVGALAACPVDNRCVGMATLAANFLLGGLAPGGYHLVNLGIHVVATLIIYLVVRLLGRTPRVNLDEGSRGRLALAAALVFCVHPLQTMAVTYVVQRFASLAALFALASVATWLAARLEPRAGRRFALFAASLFAAALAMKTKQNAVTLPLALALTEVALFEGPLARRLAWLTPWALLVLLPLSALFAAGAAGGAGVAEGLRADTTMSRAEYALTELTVVPAYLRLLVLPVGQTLDHHPTTYSTLALAPVAGGLFLLALAALAARLVSRGADGRLRLVGWGVLWFFATLVVESSFIPIADVMVEHRLYLPSAGLLLSLVAGVSWLLERLGARRGWSPARTAATASALLGLVAVALGAATFVRNEVWRDELALWNEASARAPGFWRPHANAGRVLLERNQCAEAIGRFQAALALDDLRIVPWLNLALCQAKLGRTAEAIATFRSVAAAGPADGRASRELGKLLAEQGDLEGALVALETSARAEPQVAETLTELGAVLAQLGQLAPAVAQLERAVALDPASSTGWNNLANARSMTEDQPGAVQAWRRALECDPANTAARENLARTLDAAGQVDQAATVRAGGSGLR